MDVLYSWVVIIFVAAIVLGLLFLFIKAAAKSAIRDILEELELKKKQEEEQKKW